MIKKQDNYSFSDLCAIMAFLRSPEGCPWDKVQTHASIAKNMIEEAWECVAAIERQDQEELLDELGDVLLQVVFHAQMAQEAGAFSMAEVIDHLSKKLLSRHTHLFAEDIAETPAAVLETWAKNKRAAEKFSSAAEALQAVPLGLPSLSRAYKIQKRAAESGFDWADFRGAAAKLQEELGELTEVLALLEQQQLASGELQAAAVDPESSPSESENSPSELAQAAPADLPSKIEDEAGDVLFATVNVLRHLKLDPELTLNKSCAKFVRRFAQFEAGATALGQKISDLDEATSNRIYAEIKAKERGQHETR